MKQFCLLHLVMLIIFMTWIFFVACGYGELVKYNTKSRQCSLKTTSCLQLKNKTCLGVQIPYTTSSNDLVRNISFKDGTFPPLNHWQHFRAIPKCWEVIQPLLCSIYYPKCGKENNDRYVDKPSRALCDSIVEPCKILGSKLPAIFHCNGSLYGDSCKVSKIDLAWT